MKIAPLRLILIVTAAALAAAACSPRPRAGAVPSPTYRAAADELFQKAERSYGQKAYEEALMLYHDYLSRYPDEPLAPAALMKIGSVHSLQGNPARARLAYSQLISEYPANSFRPEAMLEILTSLYKEGEYREVVGRASAALPMMGTPGQRFRALSVIGDAYTALEAPLEAVGAYTGAMRMAGSAEQETVALKLRTVLLQLSSDDVEALAARRDDSLPMDYLLFQAGMLFAREGRRRDALVLLNAFKERYPYHSYAARAAEAIVEIEKTGPREGVTLGALLPLSGSYQAIGQKAMRGLELAVSQYNARGTPPVVRLVVKDTASEEAATLQALRDVERENAAAVVGPLVHAEAAAHEAQRLGLPMIAITQRDQLAGLGPYVFRNFVTPRAQVHSLVAYAVGRLGIRRAAILYPDETYGRTFMALFREEFEARGGVILDALAYSPAAVDFAPVINRLLHFSRRIPKEERPVPRPPEPRRRAPETKDYDLEFEFEALFLPDEPKKAGMLIPQLFYHDIKGIQLLGTNLWSSEALIRLAEPYVQGAIMPDGFFAGSSEVQTVRFISAFEGAFQEKPGIIEAIVYDSAWMVLEAASRPEVRLRGDVAAFLRRPEGFAGVTGLTRFDSSGEVEKALRILQVRGNRFIELD
jgi:ABC-type branched-subunit amino acid transport system substrate-binding protein